MQGVAARMDSRSPSTREGDSSSLLEELVREHQVMVYRYARFLVRDVQLAEEIAQDTFVTAYTKLRQEPLSGDVAAWLRGVARNLALRARAKLKTRVLLCDDETLVQAEGMYLQGRERAPASESSQTRLEALRRCMETLDASEARILKLRFEERRSREHIAQELMLSAEGVKTRLRRLRMKLLECTQRRLSTPERAT